MPTPRATRRSVPVPAPRLEPLESRLLLATLPAGFAESKLADILQTYNGATVGLPTAMQFAPDGRLFILTQGGSSGGATVRIIKDGALLPTAFLTIPAGTVDHVGERGLLGIAFDPAFATNRRLYLYYTLQVGADGASGARNRVSRFTADGDVAVPGSEQVIFELDNLSGATNHNGGAMHFGADGKLYIATGENATTSNAQSLANTHGKVLRINADGSIPTDNPFYAQTSGNDRAIWALGLRNPFTFDVERGTGRMFINDVGSGGSGRREEINLGGAGVNFGWPGIEGVRTTQPLPSIGTYRDPTWNYEPSALGGCAITGGAFYNPAAFTFPSSYAGDYFYADYCGNWIRRLDTSGATPTSTVFATGLSSPVDLKVGPDGALYYLQRGSSGEVWRVAPSSGVVPTIAGQPESLTRGQGQSATFTVSASGPGPYSYQWQRDGQNIPGATSASYVLDPVVPGDDGAQFRVVVSNASGGAISNAATLTVTSNQPATASITQPAAGATYQAGQTVHFAGTATDPETGPLGGSAFSWRVDFHHADHVHPFLPDTAGATSGSFVVPTVGHVEADVFYRITLTVTDPFGHETTTSRDVLPVTSTTTLASDPAGVTLLLDGQPRTTPHAFLGVAGVQRTVEAPASFVRDGQTYEFTSWSDGGARAHDISTPAMDTTLTALYRDATPPGVDDAEFTGGAGAHSVSFHFTEPVVGIADSSLELVNLSTGQTVPTASIDSYYDPLARRVTFTFPGLAGGLLPGGTYAARLLKAGIADASAGNALADDHVHRFLYVPGTAGDDTVRIRQNFPLGLVEAYVNVPPTGGPPTYTAAVPPGLDQLVIDAGDGADRVILDFSGGPLPIAAISLDAGPEGDADALRLVGRSVADVADLNPLELTFNGQKVGLLGTVTIELDARDGDDVLTVGPHPLTDPPLPVAIRHRVMLVNDAGEDRVEVDAAVLTLVGDGSNAPGSWRLVGTSESRITAATALRLRELALQTGSTLVLAGGPVGTGPIDLAADARIDVGTHGLVVQAAPGGGPALLGQVTALVTAGRAGGTWDGPGIGSSAADALRGLGVILNGADGLPLRGTFAGLEADADSVLVKFTYDGDADLSGRVDAADYRRIDRGRSLGLAGYANGDFNYSGDIPDADDYLEIDPAFVRQGAPLASDAAPAAPPASGAPAPAAARAVFAARRLALPELFGSEDGPLR